MNIKIDPFVPEKLVDALAQELLNTASFHYMPGMRVWGPDQKWIRLDDPTNWAPNIKQPDLCDHATIGCIIQQAWRITEVQKQKAYLSVSKYISPYSPNMIMGNVEPPQVVLYFSKALGLFALNGITDIQGLYELVNVFKCT